MDLADLIYKIKKLIFLNRLLISFGVESLECLECREALYALEDEIEQLEAVYTEVKEQFEKCI